MLCAVLVVAVVLVVAASGLECPFLPGQLGQPQDLDITSLNVFVDPERVSCELALPLVHIIYYHNMVGHFL